MRKGITPRVKGAAFAAVSIALMSALALSGCATKPSSSPGLTLSLIHINDTHSQFDASPAAFANAELKPVYTFIGGHPRLLSQAQALRQQAKQQQIPALFLHGGDAFKGSAYFELFEQNINIDVLNRMQIDAMALGNHEFDIGLSKLADFISRVNFPLLAANVDVSKEPTLSGSDNLKPYRLFVVRQQQLVAVDQVLTAEPMVAVFGLALEDMRAIAPGTGAVVFENEVQTAQRTVDTLTARGVTHIVALTHLGNQRDLALAAAVNGIDAIVGGHSHSLLGDFRHWYLGQQKPYAAMVTNPDGQGSTCVVQAGQFAQAVGQATLTFDSAGKLTSCDGQNTLLASKDYYTSALRQQRIAAAQQTATEHYVAKLPGTALVDEDAALRQHLDAQYLPAVQQAYGQQIGLIEHKINHVRLPGTEGSSEHGSALAGIIADAMLQWVNQPAINAITGKAVDVALIGAGNIRAPLAAGPVYEGHIRLEVLPFDTPLSILQISGDKLAELLCETIGATLLPGAHAGKYPYSGGLRYTALETAPGEVKLTNLQLWRDGRWQDIQPDERYTLVTTQYLANGNDGWQILQQIQQHHTDRQDVILREGKPEVFNVKKVIATRDSSGASAFKAQYQDIAALPCKAQGVDCKVAAQAVIDYVKATPEVLQRERQPTVTLQR